MNHLSITLQYLADCFIGRDFIQILFVLSIIFGSILINYYIFLPAIHETGHLIFGRLTGYTLLMFRIGSIAFINDTGRIRIKKYSAPGSAGQCLMKPPEYKQGRNPFVLYNIGGVILDTVMLLFIRHQLKLWTI
jgi:hypothetical protein